MKTIHHLVFWFLVVCRYTWSQRVDGRYSQWSSWSACSKSCDGGKKYRSRSCTNPRPANGGRGCWRLGTSVDSRICDTTKCPVDGHYSQWGSWSACSKPCDGGTKYRSRSCTNPPPTNGGRYCWRLGQPVESQNCNTQKCPVHGGFSQWSYWSRCTQSCGGGRQRRHRSCTNPQPANGGKDCRGLGQATKSRKCNTFGCPVDGRYSQWGSWSACSKSCDGGRRYRYRSCTNPPQANGGRYCRRLGPPGESQICNTHKCPVHGGYSHWSSWSHCSRSCDGGAQHRNRSCNNPRPSYGGKSCWSLGKAVDSRKCNTFGCPVDGHYSQWSSWSACSQSCDGGKKYRYRSCTNPPPANGGRYCWRLGPPGDSQICNTHKCSGNVHGGYSQWSYWSQCSQSCGGGTQHRNHSCTNLPPATYRRDCNRQGQVTESRKCNSSVCPDIPVHGGYSQWSSWWRSSCSKSCGGGVQQRVRTCTNPPKANRGRDCSGLGDARETRSCNTHKCPVTYTESCRDISGDEICSNMKRYCETNQNIRLDCAKTCGACQVCQNSASDSYCNRWAGYCSSGNPAFSKFCKKRCGLCQRLMQ